MMKATATEVKNNFGKYLEIAQTQSVQITKNGKTIAVLKNEAEERQNNLESLRGWLKLDEMKSWKEQRTEETAKKYGF
ncbi:MAG: type II toxin-antitoxin system prevent-host-death family antitoxin [Streptococcaceae bacterium]|jgi:antitoxin (DNA-binding transcriptional repressor) of toxin-antitoxin stability system|nr:type II toxin-antitoxin system prevent-host-death family antitoxin [Streptococcaceae bacterium]